MDDSNNNETPASELSSPPSSTPLPTQGLPRPRRPTRDLPTAPSTSSPIPMTNQVLTSPAPATIDPHRFTTEPDPLLHESSNLHSQSPVSGSGSASAFNTPASPSKQDWRTATGGTVRKHQSQSSTYIAPAWRSAYKVPSTTVDESLILTPLRAHYLKKTLLSLEFNKELGYITSSPLPAPLSILSLLGPPFQPLPSPNQIPNGLHIRDVPFLRFMFRQFVLTFPFLASAPKDFFPSKLQPFVDSLLSRNLSSDISLFPDDVDSEEAEREKETRAKTLAKLEKQMSLILGSAIKLEEKEEVVRLNQTDLDKLEENARKRARREEKSKGSGFTVNVISVRTVTEKGRVRKKHHEVWRYTASILDLLINSNDPQFWLMTIGVCHPHSRRRFRRRVRVSTIWRF